MCQSGKISRNCERKKKMDKIRGTNLGNWLVLEKWMSPSMFEGSGAEDETWLNRNMKPEVLAERMKQHRDTYVTEEDFKYIAEHGLNMVRIPVPYFIFGDYPPYIGCIEYLDKAFEWAGKYKIKILVDLHTTPGGQNGYDNGSIVGVCKWRKNPKDVEFILTVLERLAERYAGEEALFGIEVLNEPISLPVYLTAPTTGKAVDKEEAKGSGFVPMSFLKPFYTEAYQRMRKYLSEDKAIVFHDGFRLRSWNRFFKKSGMKNVYLDTHIYIFAMELFVPIHKPWVYRIYIGIDKWRIKRTQKAIPVIVGEWCICNRYATHLSKKPMISSEAEKEQRKRFLEIAKLELDAWSIAAGWFYWSYQLYRDRKEEMDEPWKEPWALSRCFDHEWLPQHMNEV
jgi:glucan 1,3-beta-glucosidase